MQIVKQFVASGMKQRVNIISSHLSQSIDI